MDLLSRTSYLSWLLKCDLHEVATESNQMWCGLCHHMSHSVRSVKIRIHCLLVLCGGCQNL